MSARLFTLSVLAAGLSVVVGRGADDAKPRWKATGPYFAVVTHTTDRTTTTATEDTTEKIAGTFVYQVTQAERKGGGWDIEHVLKRVSGDGTELDAWKKCVGVAVTLEFDASMAFQKVGGMDKFVEKFTDGEEMEAAERSVVRDVLTDSLLNKFGEAYFSLPSDKPRTVTRKGVIAGLLSTETDRVYAMPKAEKTGLLAYRFAGADKITVADDQSALPFKIVKLDEKKAAKPTGTVWFDPALGRPTRVRKSYSFEIGMTVSAGGQEGEMSLAETSELDIRYVAKMPPDDR